MRESRHLKLHHHRSLEEDTTPRLVQEEVLQRTVY
jgi:hypothetical protein